MKFKIEEKQEKTIAYMRRVGAYGPENYSLMAKLKNWAAQNNLFNEDTVIYGIARDNAQVAAPKNCRYDVGLVVPSGFLNTQIEICGLPGGKYLVFEIEHTAQAVEDFWANLLEILKRENIEADESRPILERYAKKLIDKDLCEICVPVI